MPGDSVRWKASSPPINCTAKKNAAKMRRADGDKELYRKRIRRRRLVDEVEKSVQAKERKHQSQQIARNDRNNLRVSSPLDRPRVRLHGLKVGR
jgi:hypothetical protein